MNDNTQIRAAIFGISRLRMGIDGPGVTTLITFMGCHLKCMYCLNSKCHEPIYEEDGKTLRRGVLMLTPQELYDRVKIDNIYFQATGGGICFGGGEPGLQYEFIEEFRRICDPNWKLTIETALGYPDYMGIVTLSGIIDNWIIDIKDLSDEESYVGVKGHNSKALDHIAALRHFGCQDKLTIKVPTIPCYSDSEKISKFKEWCKAEKLKVIETKYLTPDEQKRKRNM